MKALVVTKAKRLEMKNLTTPRPAHFQALARILACGICSTTDSELIKGDQPYHNEYPCVLGHEAVGEIIEIGAGVQNLKIGDWVTRPVAILPGTYRDGFSSAWGGYSEFGLVTDIEAMVASGDYSMKQDYTALRQNVLRDGKSLGLRACVLSIALAETYNWSDKLDLTNKIVCINGTGIAGLSLALWAKMRGVRQLIVLGRRQGRLLLANELGADQTINLNENSPVEMVRNISGGGVDVFMEATGVPSQMEVAIRSVKAGGVVGVYGVAPHNQYRLDWNWLPSDIRITQHEPQEHLARRQVMDLLASGKVPVDKLMTHQWPIDDFEPAFKAIKGGEVVKSMLVIANEYCSF